MKKGIKTLIGILFCFLVSFPLIAFPGINAYCPNASGQYVYYRDYSFDFEAYVGFLCYDEGTYAMRFFAPQYPMENAPVRAGKATGFPKSIDILFTVNPDIQHTELTGERFLSIIESSDTEIVNYMHDLVYEFSARRRAAGQVTETLQVQDDFDQFGGTVTMEYSFDVPIFNLKQICSKDGNPIFQMITAGALVSSSDTSFSSFEGFPAPLKDIQRKFTSKHKKSNTEIKYNDQSILLDDQWSQAADNMFFLGDVAVLVMSDFPASKDSSTESILDSFSRVLSLGTQNSYAVWNNRKIEKTKKSLSVEISYFLPKENAVSRDFKIITKNQKSESFSVISLTVFDNAYKTNKEYFDSILKSYKN